MQNSQKKIRSSANIQLIQRIARETRSDTLARLQASAEGLSTARAEQNREEYGANTIKTNKQASIWKMLLESFTTPYTLILIVVTLLTIFTNYIMIPHNEEGNYTTLIMGIMIVISVVINFSQKVYISKVEDKLFERVNVTTNIKRDGESVELPTEDVVVGDVINIKAGDMIPADMKLLTSKDLFCNSGFLSRDEEPVEKLATVRIKPADDNYLDYPNILYEGSTIVSGSGTGIVFAVGDKTLFGQRTAKLAAKKHKKTVFEREVSKLTHILVIAILIIIPALFLINGLTKHDWAESLIFALVAAVGITPEMLPIIVNSNLTIGATDLFKHGISTEKITTIQNLGASDVLCVDKTGTLTQNKVVLERHYDFDLQETPRILKFAYLNGYYQTGVKDLIDKAIIDAASDELDVNEIQRDYNKIDEIPFDYTRKRMSVVVVDNDQHHGRHLLVTKGAAEEMLDIATKVENDGHVELLTDKWREKILDQIDELNDDGLRVLLLGYKVNPAPVGEFSAKDENDLILIGYIAYLDPPKESTKAALTALQDNHINVKIFTGDNEAVTRAVSLQAGLNIDNVLTGEQVKQASADEVSKMVENCNIFVRLTPILRVKVIKALQANGHTVSYLGDGNKDADAMQVADVTFSTNKAVDIAKEAADIFLKEKDLSMVNKSFMIGRRTFSNTMKYIKVILAANFGSILIMIIASLILPFLPLLPLQILLIDLLFSICCLAIPFDNVSKEYLKKPQRWSIKKWPKFVYTFGPLLTLVDLLTVAYLTYFICPQNVSHLRWSYMSLFYAGLFLESIFTKIMVIYNLRSKKNFFSEDYPSLILFISTVIIAIVSILLVQFGGSQILGFSKLPLEFAWYLIIIEILYTVLTSLVKKLYLRKNTF